VSKETTPKPDPNEAMFKVTPYRVNRIEDLRLGL